VDEQPGEPRTPGQASARRSTSTSEFGVSRRESHDASAFYERFELPELSTDETILVAPDLPGDGCINGDARDMSHLPDNSVALVVTSPPYFAGKQYEVALGQGGVPTDYVDFLRLLRDVFVECVRVLEPGGRIAVNVANLGRKPYRSLSADVIRILQDDLRLLLRGEVIWQKGEGASGNCAWGSYSSAANPVLRDITERVIIASKGRFGRAKSIDQRANEGLPHESTLAPDDFMNSTLDLWRIDPESARRVGHPAPFPVALPEQLIHLFTYRGDLVLDPFMGSGSALVAAKALGRRWAGYDTDADYVAIARERLAAASVAATGESARVPVAAPAPTVEVDPDEHFQARATREGKTAQGIALRVIAEAGFTIVKRDFKVRGTGVTINALAEDAEGQAWWFDVTGAFTTTRGGLIRTDTMWKCLGRAHVIQNKPNRESTQRVPLIFLTSHLPPKGSAGDTALRAAGPDAFFDAMEMYDSAGQERLAQYAGGGHYSRPLPGFWTEREIARLT
jgi:site-specific DNA-methyltransferase (adenine-specific)